MVLDDCFATILECMNIISGFAVFPPTTYFDASAISEYHFNQYLTGKSAEFLPAPPGDKYIIVLH